MVKNFGIIILSFLLTSKSGENLEDFFKDADGFFRSIVKGGKLNYARLKDDRSELDGLVGQIGSARLSSNLNQRKAFYINAYNILVIKSALNNYPVKSVLDIPGFFDGKRHEVAGKMVTLDQLEKKIIMKEFNDPKLHFALVCAAISCPPLPSHAYWPENLDSQLLQRARKVLNDSRFIRLDTGAKKVYVSKIFEWYKSDFTEKGESVIYFINKYRDKKIPTDWTVGYHDYDWSLNDLK